MWLAQPLYVALRGDPELDAEHTRVAQNPPRGQFAEAPSGRLRSALSGHPWVLTGAYRGKYKSEKMPGSEGGQMCVKTNRETDTSE